MAALDHTPFVDCSGTQLTYSPLPRPPENLASAENTPSNGVVEACPALTESTSQGPPAHLRQQNYAACNANPKSTSNHATTARHGNGGGARHGGFVHPFQPPAQQSFTAFQPSILNNIWNPRPVGGYLLHPHPIYDHRGMSPRLNYNPIIRGNGVHQNNGSYSNGRNIHMHQWRPRSRNFFRPAISSSYVPPTPFFPQQAVRANGNPMFYPNLSYVQQLSVEALLLVHYRGPQFASHYLIIQPIPKPLISNILVYQINYYFCDANLVGDWFLKEHMDDHGWVSIHVVANFPRVKELTNDIQLILESLKVSTVVEVQGYKIRQRNNWINWIPHKNPRLNQLVSPSESSQDLSKNFQTLKIEEELSSQTSTNGCEDSTFGDSTRKIKELPNGEVAKNSDSRK